MYTLSVSRTFEAFHYLIGGDWGDENRRHSHLYKVDAILSGNRLDRHGYLLDIVDLETRLDALVAFFSGQTLNDLAPFAGLNPSIEHFARIFLHMLIEPPDGIDTGMISRVQVRIWENDIAWAAFEQSL